MKNIIFHEALFAEEALRTGNLGSQPYQALVSIARYFISQGFAAEAIRERVNALYNRERDRGFTDIAESVVREARKRELVDVPFIPITAAELKTIRGIDGIRRQRVAFALLTLAKYQNHVHGENHGWVSFRRKDVFSMANVKVSVTEQYLLLNDLKSMGLLKYNRRVDNLNVRVLYAEHDGAPVLEIFDMRNLGNQYMRYLGGAFVECKACGVVAPRKSPRQLFCAECAKLENAKRSVDFYRRKIGVPA
jgi:hypothetical protein